MNGSKFVAKCLLVTKRKPQRVTSPPGVELSPLLTNFEKWSDKKRKLYFRNDTLMSTQGLGNLQLERNLFASLLASPMRCDRLSRSKIPKDFLTQLKLKELEHKTKHSLELVAVGKDTKGGKSSYVVNSNALLNANSKSPQAWIPTPALMSNMRYFNVPDVLVDRENIVGNYVLELRERLKEELGKLKKNDTAVTLQNWDVVVSSEIGAQKSLEVIQWKSVNIIVFNVRFLDRAPWVDQAVQPHRNHELGLVLRLPEHKAVLKHLYRVWAFYSLLI